MPHWPGLRTRSTVVVLALATLTGFISPSFGSLYPSLSLHDALFRWAPHAQIIAKGSAVSIDSTWTVPGRRSEYGLFRIAIDQVLKGEEFLEDPQQVLIVESTFVSVLGLPQRPNEYRFAMGEEYLFVISGPCEWGYRKLDFPPFPIDSTDAVASAFTRSSLPWDAFKDSCAVALESRGLNSVATMADLCATVVAIDVESDPRIESADYMATVVVQDVRYQPMDTAIETGDTLSVLGPRGTDDPGPVFDVWDTLLVFCTRSAANHWQLVPNVASALLQTGDQFVARAKSNRCSCPSCPPYPIAHYSETAVNDAISIR